MSRNDAAADVPRSVAIEYLSSMTRANRSEVTESPAVFEALKQGLSEKGLKLSFVARGDASKDVLCAMGLEPHERHVVMLAETKEIAAPSWSSANPPVSGEVSVRRVKDGRSEWLELLLDGFEVPDAMRPKFISAHSVLTGGDPRAHLYEAVVEEKRVGACFMWVENGIAGLHTATVLPAYRGKGVHRAMFEARVKEALRLSHGSDGAPSLRWIATETAIPSVERTASSFGLRSVLEYRFWY